MQTQKVNYRGLVQFNLPAHWQVEIGEINGGTFYEDSADSGTLRLEVMTFQDEERSNSALLASLITNSGYTALGDHLALKTSIDRTEEDGEMLTIYYWEIGAPFLSNQLNIFGFSYVMLSEQEDLAAFKTEVQWLANAIKQAQYQTGI